MAAASEELLLWPSEALEGSFLSMLKLQFQFSSLVILWVGI